jgi:hypothetical protein
MNRSKKFWPVLAAGIFAAAGIAYAEEPTPGFNSKIPEDIMTPDRVDTRIGTLEFTDGRPTPTRSSSSTT